MKSWLIITIVILFTGTYAYFDYRWGEKIIAKNELQFVVAKKDWSIAKPWTWFVQPINKVVWLKQFAPLTYPWVIVNIVYIEKGKSYEELSVVMNLKDKTITIEDPQKVASTGPWNDEFKWIRAEGIYKDVAEFMVKKVESSKLNNPQ